MKIYLVGMPGSGKSHLGKQLAIKLGLPFFDLDAEVEKTEGKTVAEVFRQFGEEYFRQSEADILRLLSITQPRFLIATGGGSACFHDNMALMNLYGLTIFLDTPLETILGRLLVDGPDKRPLLRENPEGKIKSLYENRLQYYSKSQIRISQTDIPELEKLILHQTRK